MADVSVGVRIKALRQSLKLTQQKVADSVGVSKTSVIYWEKDENIPKHESLSALARILNTSTDYILYGDSGNPQENKALSALMRNLELLDAANKLPPELVAMLQNTLNTVVNIQDNQDKMAAGQDPAMKKPA
jgi:transcriptional regulator with XRE-family HTH domain